MIPLLILYFLIAILDWLAVAKGWKKVEYVAKPSAMLVLLGPLVFLARFGSVPLICFSLGIFFSLVGDVFLMFSYARFSDRWFLPGLAAFLLAHLTYIIGLNIPSPGASPLWSFGLGILLALSAARLLRRILAGVTQKGLGRLVRPVALYGMVITLMLLSALLTFFSSWWNVSAAALVASGAILFYFSDTLLAWDKFVIPVKNGRLVDMILYHLGQLALVAGVLLQFAK
jgi:alkenylglycerophosphocholine/alkenylglycerophosphoethanolamine hydrolase